MKTVIPPLAAYAEEDHFKLFVLDVGILSTMAKTPLSMMNKGDSLFREFKGSLTENFVAQEITVKGLVPLYYWSSGNRAEVDFVLENDGKIFPLEVKSGINLKAKSLSVFAGKFKCEALCRTSLADFSRHDPYHDYPLYSLCRFPNISEKTY